MTTPADAILEILERPYYDGLPFTALELLAIIRTERFFDKPQSAASIWLRLNHLVEVGKVIRLDPEHVIARHVH